MNDYGRKRTEAEKCNGWLRKMGAFAYCVFECDGDFPNDYEMFDYYIEKVKEHDGPLVSKYLKSLESNDTKQRKEAILKSSAILIWYISKMTIIGGIMNL